MPSLDMGIYLKFEYLSNVNLFSQSDYWLFLTLRPVHLQAKYIQKQATFSDENLTQKSVSIKLFVAVK